MIIIIWINVIIFWNYMFCEVYKSQLWRHGYPADIRYPDCGFRRRAKTAVEVDVDRGWVSYEQITGLPVHSTSCGVPLEVWRKTIINFIVFYPLSAIRRISCGRYLGLASDHLMWYVGLDSGWTFSESCSLWRRIPSEILWVSKRPLRCPGGNLQASTTVLGPFKVIIILFVSYIIMEITNKSTFVVLDLMTPPLPLRET